MDAALRYIGFAVLASITFASFGLQRLSASQVSMTEVRMQGGQHTDPVSRHRRREPVTIGRGE